MTYLQYAVWAIAAFFILSWTFALFATPGRMSAPNRCTLISWWACGICAALGFYSVYHLLWLMPLAVILGSLGIGVVGAAIAVLAFFIHHFR